MCISEVSGLSTRGIVLRTKETSLPLKGLSGIGNRLPGEVFESPSLVKDAQMRFLGTWFKVHLTVLG